MIPITKKVIKKTTGISFIPFMIIKEKQKRWYLQVTEKGRGALFHSKKI